MALNYTYDDVIGSANKYGITLSEYDDALARSNPNAGMSIVNDKYGWLNSTSDEERAGYNASANETRSKAGNYTGGSWGNEYNYIGDTPSSFTAETAPTYADTYGADKADAYGAVKNYGSFTDTLPKPEYTDSYSDKANSLIDNIVNYGDFSYDTASDPSYSAYKKAYTREGKRATADALGEAASATGGIPSSYAVTAATQAGDYYASKLSDKIPELYESAYNRYLDEFSKLQNQYSTVNTAQQNEYNKYLNELSQYNTDRNFNYQNYSDEYSRLLDQYEAAREAESDQYGKYQDQLSQYNTDRNYGYNQFVDNLNYVDERAANQTAAEQTAADRALSNATTAAQYGDYSQLEALGIQPDTSSGYTLDDALSVYSKTGDASLLNAMGINPTAESTGSTTTYSDTQKAYRASAAQQLLQKGIVNDYVKQAYEDYFGIPWETLVAAGYVTLPGSVSSGTTGTSGSTSATIGNVEGTAATVNSGTLKNRIKAGLGSANYSD